MAFTYPILLDITDLPILIVGGGEVALRKAQGLLAAGATRVRALAPDFHAAFPASIEQLREPYAPQHLKDVRLVFAATDDPQVNQTILADAAAAGILANRADHDAVYRGDFSLPAVHRDGSLIVAVSTGHSPAISAAIRDLVAAALDPGWARLAGMAEELRPRVLAKESLPPEQRRKLLRLLATSEAMRVAQAGDVELLWNWLLRQHSPPPGDVE